MITDLGNRRQEILDELKSYLKNRLPAKQAALLHVFAIRYYDSCSLEDLIGRPIHDLFGALLSHWNLVYQRKPGESKIRVYNPTVEKDGWHSTHTIIQVSHDDIPFLVDSIRMEINRRNLQIHFTIHFGGLKVSRDKTGKITDILPMDADESSATTEAPIYFEIDRLTESAEMESLHQDIDRVLRDVRATVSDWHNMVNCAKEMLSELEQTPPPLDPADIAESKDFLRWIMSGNFTFLGSRDYKLIGNNSNRALQLIPGSGLGVLRDETEGVTSRRYADLPPQARKLALSKHILIIAKTNTQSTVHRTAYTDYIGVKRFNEKGELLGERRFIGLYTSAAYSTSPRYIPFLRHKVASILQKLRFPPDGHNGKAALSILETLPRDDLFQATEEELFQLTLNILHLQERRHIRLFIRKDSYDRFFSCLVYVPREMFNTELLLEMEDVLMENLRGEESSFSTYFSDSVLARIHYIIRVNPKKPIEYDIIAIEQKLITVARSWPDELKLQLIKEFDEAEGLKYHATYRRAFPASYTEYYSPLIAIKDIKKIESLSSDNPLAMQFYRAGANALRLKLFHTERTIALSDVLPALENMGLRVIEERPHEIIFKEGNLVWINDFDLVYTKYKEIEVEKIREKFQDAFVNIWFGLAENDGFNRLVLEAELTWQETTILRAYTKYLRQLGFTFSQNYVEQALVNNTGIAKKLIELFILRFSPETAMHAKPDVTVITTQIDALLDEVTSLDEDRILRRLLEVILATTRTNYFQKTADDRIKPYISFKLDPAFISDLPLPRPLYEIFVYSPRMEGVHLRGGKVARGGIRWSDRREDFRTEVLGLMKAQQVKNAVIVPVGAKGGFFAKTLPVDGDRDAILKEGIFCYSTFIRGLLDITDNVKDNQIIPPVNVVRYDTDDSYLVVAADKGTATFSDIANGIAAEYHFWLGDAFASGGSMGYDHKKMGITARGVWESVKRHFRELGLNPEKDHFTVVGIGDMAGDVFGNGLLQSDHMKLIGAYNHLHIFLDPDPDPSLSFKERNRLFQLPRSSWADYNPDLLSKGGGVFSRAAKSIKLSPEIRKAFNTKKESMTPHEVIRAMLTAPVDLIWNGGIGTFVKSSEESHTDVGDRTNDVIRINGNEITAKVIAEGGNLGLTQLGRVEYALHGGILYTDFIDNSAGVDCSDHEVNIKILFNQLVAQKKMSLRERNQLLEKMTQEVSGLVLRDNYEQTQMLSLEASVSLETMDLIKCYIGELEKAGRLNRSLEFLPDDKMLMERKANGQGLTRPEMAILLAYCKMFLKQDILSSPLPENPYFVKHLSLAFPKSMRKKYLQAMTQHKLRREIIATQLAKQITDHMGIYFIERIQRETGASIASIVHAYIISETIYGMDATWSEIEALDHQVKPQVQQKMMLQLYSLIRRATRWFVRNYKSDMAIEKTIHDFSKPIAELMTLLPTLLMDSDVEELKKVVQSYVAEGVPKSLAITIANCNILFTSLDIVEAARKYHFSIKEVARTYYAFDTHLELNWLRAQINAYPMENQWDELARSGFRDDLDRVQRNLSVSVLKSQNKKHAGKKGKGIEEWLHRQQPLMERWQNLLAEIKSSHSVGFVTYSVILRELFDFAQIELG